MSWFHRVRATLVGERYCPPEHLESYRRLGQEVYAVEVELAECEHPKAKAFLMAAKCLQVMAEALLLDAYNAKSVPMVTHEQAEEWYGKLTDLMIAARQEHAFEGGARLRLPVHIGQRAEAAGICPVSHLAAMRRSADAAEDLIRPIAERAKRDGDKHKSAILLFEEARTRRQAGDAIVGAIARGQYVPKESHEEAEEQYWTTLKAYVLAVQGLIYPECLQEPGANPSRTCKLDLNDIWKVTSENAKAEIRRAGEWRKAEEDLREHWSFHRPTSEEREYETSVEDYLVRGQIREDGYWYCCPFQPVYRVMADPVTVLGRHIPRGHVFVWEYGDDGAPGRFITATSFNSADSRQYCDD